ncbi:N-acetylglucosamine-6-phosphate deacetylase [Tabrizicola sp.]|jgi:N-acetylglucosamine-6-phosphate deacetylase|uniref:N-acetylglucosamine-6-phosphate deacetylase n=1 Tax=Tabrizicola sp. TaxID=2005166 RepID=UPI0025D9C7D1|nr:N-acetylglucosamine-6-phosphate deacetylase [Tabrizicola sp.]MBY0351858.1 N-acetylglucosamine-6-phosphate deacetylase [Tabrizicola sp.]MDK2774244.1 N-acetylglucosamine-6-phosphate deacetylase [Tabrizicola sp.]
MSAKPDLWLVPDALFDGQSLRTDVALGIAGSRSVTVTVTASLPTEAPARRLSGTLTPGFLDLQVNGGGDALLNNDQTRTALRTMALAHRRFGTVGILPTIITDAPPVLSRAVDAVIAARGEPGLLGLHIEGPHLSIARRGTHAAEHIRPFDATTLAHIRRLRSEGIFVKITVAPESVTPAQVRQITATGAVVSIGHSDATAAETRALLDAGATCFTHLFNAMSPMLHRAPGVTGACINSTAYAGIICDGIHVADEMIGLASRARPVAGRMFLVSDAMSTVGGSDHFRLYRQDVWLRNGRLVNAEGSLAGAHVTMAEGLRRLITQVGISPQTALDMAVAAPARLIDCPELATPEHRDLADLLCLDADWHVSGTLADMAGQTAA